MIEIILTKDSVEGEPGPNFYWRGEKSDFLKLVIDLHSLGAKSGIEINLSDFDYVQIKDKYKVKAISLAMGSNKLVSIEDNTIMMECNCYIWQQVLYSFLSISFFPSHNYVDFDNEQLIEQANFIISSEA